MEIEQIKNKTELAQTGVSAANAARPTEGSLKAQLVDAYQRGDKPLIEALEKTLTLGNPESTLKVTDREKLKLQDSYKDYLQGLQPDVPTSMSFEEYSKYYYNKENPKQDYGLAVGTKKNGYTYMGGNPNSKSSWRED